MSNTRVAVLLGGPSREHEVSLRTGRTMLDNLDTAKFAATKVLVSKTNEWFFGSETDGFPLGRALTRLKSEFDVVLIGLHGTFGEDGTIQALLENSYIPYTGSGAAASLIAMDKTVSNALYADYGLPIPVSYLVTTENKEAAENHIHEMFRLPVVIKPARQGSSVGVHLVTKSDMVSVALDDALSYDQTAIVQEFINGREVSCGVLEDPETGELKALPPTELIPVNNDFYDYEAKYSEGGTTEITPPDMADEIITSIQQQAVRAHEIIGCSAYSRTDMIVRDGIAFMIETNTLPGMTSLSIIPQQAAAINLPLAILLENLITCALERKND